MGVFRITAVVVAIAASVLVTTALYYDIQAGSQAVDEPAGMDGQEEGALPVGRRDVMSDGRITAVVVAIAKRKASGRMCGMTQMMTMWAEWSKLAWEEYSVENYCLKEIHLDYELTSGSMRACVHRYIDTVIFYFDGINTVSNFSVNVPYTLLPPVTSHNTFAFGVRSSIGYSYCKRSDIKFSGFQF